MDRRINLKNNNLSKAERIKKLKKENKKYLIILCIYLLIIISSNICLIVLKEPSDLGFCLLCTIPVFVHLGYILPVKQNKKRIEELMLEMQ
jgi:hypothetical protein